MCFSIKATGADLVAPGMMRSVWFCIACWLVFAVVDQVAELYSMVVLTVHWKMVLVSAHLHPSCPRKIAHY